jgi:hypothetical protein
MVVFDQILNALYSGRSNSIAINRFTNVAAEKGTDRPRPLPPISFPIHYSLIVPPFEAIQSELLAASLNNAHKVKLSLCFLR